MMTHAKQMMAAKALRSFAQKSGWANKILGQAQTNHQSYGGTYYEHFTIFSVFAGVWLRLCCGRHPGQHQRDGVGLSFSQATAPECLFYLRRQRRPALYRL